MASQGNEIVVKRSILKVCQIEQVLSEENQPLPLAVPLCHCSEGGTAVLEDCGVLVEFHCC